jgi:hypothetical protein
MMPSNIILKIGWKDLMKIQAILLIMSASKIRYPRSLKTSLRSIFSLGYLVMTPNKQRLMLYQSNFSLINASKTLMTHLSGKIDRFKRSDRK